MKTLVLLLPAAAGVAAAGAATAGMSKRRPPAATAAAATAAPGASGVELTPFVADADAAAGSFDKGSGCRSICGCGRGGAHGRETPGGCGLRAAAAAAVA
ncbi:hypothetical protein Vafri_4849 [Volvox africanus]|uniref:Uncharacterized protein n=1 Tax=Volvox africanus TaxID=51714 RepID=A0A8J4EWA0_9CHLO|nr:hypothetical protein Vafri_4849 [Volvox africanus]